MSKRRGAPVGPYSYDDDEDYVPSKAVRYSEREGVVELKEKKHSLDSDEELEEEDDEEEGEPGRGGGGRKYDILKEEDIDGQEERTVEFEGETTITPFNMKEEMEDGHFDGDGFYHFKKEEAIKDAWLDDIDWVKVKQREGDEKKYGSDLESEGESESEADILPSGTSGTLQVYEAILTFLKEGETVARALKRLGGNTKRMSSAQRWKLKKAGGAGAAGGESGDNMANFLKLTELANKIIETGNMDVYQETFELINLKVQQSKASKAEPALDMFAEAEEDTKPTDTDKDNDKDSNKDNNKDNNKDQNNGKTVGGVDHVEEVLWELRWENEEGAEVHGPFTSQKMLEWQDSGYLSKGGYVRKTSDQQQAWYSTKRIDFDLYS